MKLSLKFINKFFESPLDSKEFIDRISQFGAEVESITKFGDIDQNIIFAKIIECKDIAESKKLKKTKVFDGKFVYDVICGAKNCRTGIYVAFAKCGSSLKTDNGLLSIDSRKIFNHTSNGMLCSYSELGIGPDSDGIISIDEDIERLLGMPVSLFIRDTIIEIALTPDITRCSSSYGAAQCISLISNQHTLIDSLDQDSIYQSLVLDANASITKSQDKIKDSTKSYATISTIEASENNKIYENFLCSVYSYSISIEPTVEHIVGTICGTCIEKDKDSLIISYKSNDIILKKISSSLQDASIESVGIQLYASLYNLTINNQYSVSHEDVIVAIDINRMSNIFSPYIDRHQIMHFLDTSFRMQANNEIIIPGFLTEYHDAEHILSLISRYLDISQFKASNMKFISNSLSSSISNKCIDSFIRHLSGSRAQQLSTNSVIQNSTSYTFGITDSTNVINKHNMCLRHNVIMSIFESLNSNNRLIQGLSKDIFLHEHGKTFNNSIEHSSLCVVFIPNNRTSNEVENSDNMQTLFSILQGLSVKYLSNNFEIHNSSNYSFLHPFIQGDLLYNSCNIGFIGKIHEDISNHFHVKKPVYVAEINIDSNIVNDFKTNIITELMSHYHFDITVPCAFDDDCKIAKDKISNSISLSSYQLNVQTIRCIDIYNDLSNNLKKITMRIEYSSKTPVASDLISYIEKQCNIA
ncbi:MAG: hypothetical protein KAH32_01360 [Chlamydiia bacterium]|nr:hypothetical protein [Chlamydiia bacterium]